MVDLNKVILIGRLTRDPELRQTQGGTQIAKLGMAVNRRRNANGETHEDTCYIDLTAFGRQAEVIGQYLSKGRQVMIEGRMTPDKTTGGPRTWQAQDGSWRASYEMTSDRIIFLQGGGDAGSRGGSGGGADTMGGPEHTPEDEIPF